MTQERIEIITPNLAEMGKGIQDKAVDGYTLDEGYPMMLGYQYHAIMHKTVATVTEKKPAGRPPKA